MIRLLRKGATLTGALALTLGITPSALAQTYHYRDVSHDVGRTRGGADFNHAPHNREYDVTHLKVVHNSDAIEINVQLRSTSMKGLAWRSLGFDMRTNGHAYMGAWMAHHDAYQFFLEDTTRGKDLPIRCLNARKKRHTISLELDRTCLKSPQWIKIAVSVGGQAHGIVYQDNAQTKSWHHPLDEVFSPRIRAGQ